MAVNYKASSSAAAEVVSEITSSGGVALPFQADVAVEADVVRLFQEVSSAWPGQPLTALVNNAGVIGSVLATLGDVDTDSFQDMFTTNVLGPLICCREFAKVATRGAAIVNISSGAAVVGKPGLYAMTKGALNSMQAWLVQDLTPKGIRMNTVSPGFTRTDMTADLTENMELHKTIPLGRFGEPEEIASGVAYLLSKDASYVAGANLRISGGKVPGTFIG